jgi:AcrR family transcriptional regulator
MLLSRIERSFRILNMRSIDDRASDDRSTTARIRDAAITEFAANGVAATSVRAIAAAAGVSPGLVIHHFGSKERLRDACDEHVAAMIRDLKGGAMAAGAAFDVLAALRSQAGGPPATRYLARTLVDGSPHVAELVDELVKDAVGYTEAGVASGMIRPSNHPHERAAILTLWVLGGLVLHEHMERLIGVDITADFSQDPKAASAYMAPVLEIFGEGILTHATVQMMREAFVDESPRTHREKETA